MTYASFVFVEGILAKDQMWVKVWQDSDMIYVCGVFIPLEIKEQKMSSNFEMENPS